MAQGKRNYSYKRLFVKRVWNPLPRNERHEHGNTHENSLTSVVCKIGNIALAAEKTLRKIH